MLSANPRVLKIVLPVLLFATSTFASERVQCNSVKSKILSQSVGYCALLPPSYDAQSGRKFPILYFLHGLGGDQTFLVSTGAWGMIEDSWEQKQFPEFVLITPAADTSFYINSKSGSVRYEDFFIHEFMPEMERKFRVQSTRTGRAIGGVSMGGYGALRFAFKYPRLFSSVGAEMPALLEQLPRGAQNAGFTAFFGTAFGSPVDEAFWKANTPFVFARTANLSGLKIYVNCGDRDNYGFDSGARDLDKLLTARHVAHSIQIYPGQHNWQFMAEHLIDPLKFQAQAFGK